jgi:hypothetical protein
VSCLETFIASKVLTYDEVANLFGLIRDWEYRGCISGGRGKDVNIGLWLDTNVLLHF